MKIGPVYAGTVTTITPIFSFILEVFVLGRQLSIWVLIASILSGIGVSIIILAEKDKSIDAAELEPSHQQLSKKTLLIGISLATVSAIAWALGIFFTDIHRGCFYDLSPFHAFFWYK